MINIRTLKKLKNDDGLTLKNGKPITYKSGYQVATVGIKTRSVDLAMRVVRLYTKEDGKCGIWFSDGFYYIDRSKRVNTKKEALAIGREYNQISVLKWANMSLVYCKEV